MKNMVYYILALVLVLFSSCIFDDKSSDKDDEAKSDIIFVQEVTADNGAVIEASGYSLEIPPDALPEDTEISAVSVPPQDTPTEHILGGINFGPSGIKLKKPALVEVPLELPSDWTPGELVPIYEFPSDDPSLAVWNGYYAEITAKDGKYKAIGPVFHFSGSLFIRNCHSGTMEFIMNDFKKRGCNSEDAFDLVKEKFPDMADITVGTEKIKDKEIQRILGTFFDEKYTYNRGEEVPSDVISELSQLASEGNLVVIAFTSEEWSEMNADGLYPGMAHTAILEHKDGVVRIRNSANILSNKKLLDALGGTNLVYYDWDKINEFRELQAGVGVELTCGVSPGDLSAPDMNPYGLNIYNPLNGKDWKGIAWEDPIAFVSSALSRNWSSISGIPPRPKPWTAIKIYVQKTSPLSNPCMIENQSLTFEVTIPGFVNETLSYGRPYSLVTKDGHPGIQWYNNKEGVEYMGFIMNLNKNLQAGNTYTFIGAFIWGNVECAINFWHGAVNHETENRKVTFQSSEGTVNIEEFGCESGNIISGNFNVKIIGKRSEEETIEGTISGTFSFEHL